MPKEINSSASFTAAATSDVVERVEGVLSNTRDDAMAARQQKLDEVQRRINDLKKRGLLNRQHYSAASTFDFQQIYIRQG
jgi:hypothetical protein